MPDSFHQIEGKEDGGGVDTAIDNEEKSPFPASEFLTTRYPNGLQHLGEKVGKNRVSTRHNKTGKNTENEINFIGAIQGRPDGPEYLPQ